MSELNLVAVGSVWTVTHGHFPSECDHLGAYANREAAEAVVAHARRAQPCWEQIDCYEIEEVALEALPTGTT